MTTSPSHMHKLARPHRRYTAAAAAAAQVVHLSFFFILATLVGISSAFSPEERRYGVRQASLTFPTVSLTDSESTTVSSSDSESSSADVSILPILTTTTALTTSSGPEGTSTFLTTVTTLAGPGPSNASSTSGNETATPTTTSTAFPSLGSYSPCVDNCMQMSVSAANCSTITDPECYCTSAAFTSTLVQCVSDQCADDLSTAAHLAQAFCDLSSPSISLAFPAPSISPSPPSPASSATSETSAAASVSESETGNAALGSRFYYYQDTGISGLWTLSAVGLALGAWLCC